MQRFVILTISIVLCGSSLLFGGYQPTQTGINLWALPVDKYTSLNVDGGNPIISSCSTSVTIRACMQGFLSNWQTQGVTNVRFFIGLAVPLGYQGPHSGSFVSVGGGSVSTQARDGAYSHPWDLNLNVCSSAGNGCGGAWSVNLGLFFADVHSAGMTISPSLLMDAGIYDPHISSTVPECTGNHGNLMFSPWMPYGVREDNAFDDCQGINAAYSVWADGNPYFWGWTPFQSLVSSIVSEASGASVSFQEFEIQQERDLLDFTVQARLIYDNIRGFDVLGSVRSALGGSAGVATFSTGAANTTNTSSATDDCPGIYGPSAMLFLPSELIATLDSYYFGVPDMAGYQHGLLCYTISQSTTGMATLPPGIGYSIPSVIDIHAYPCNIDPSSWSTCLSSNATQNAETLYSDVWSFLSYWGQTGDLMVFGESSVVGYSCGSPYDPTWAVNGYKASTLYTNKASTTVFQPFNNLENSCYSNPVTVSPYDPLNP